MTNEKRSLFLYPGVFLTTASTILFEVSLTKIFSVTLWYHFAYLAVSLALFGLGAGGLGAFFGRKQLDRRFPQNLSLIAFLQAVFMILCLWAILALPVWNIMSYKGIIKLGIIFLICSVPFFLAGVCLSLIMRHYAERIPKIYFSDLAGSAVACIFFYAAISLVSGPAVVLIGAFMALIASLCFMDTASVKSRLLRAMLYILAAVIICIIHISTDVFSIKYTKSYREREDILVEKWTPLARITVYPNVFWQKNPDSPFGWGMSPAYMPEKAIQQMWIEQDASAGTPITHYTGDPDELDYLKYDVTSFVYHALPAPEHVFIIGCGGGRDVLSALAFGVPSVKACDINPVTIGLVRNRFDEFAGHIYRQPGVDVEVAEGRSCLRRQSDPYDVIQISLIDSWAATLAGAFSLSENNLYTVEAFSNYLSHLSNDGLLSITRYLFWPRNQTLRLALLGRHALEKSGVEPGLAMAVITTSRQRGMASMLMGKHAFTEAQIQRIRDKADSLAFEVLYLPGSRDNDPEFQEALTIQNMDAFYAKNYYDLRPSTDDRPFFFQMMYFGRAFDLIFKNSLITGQRFNYFAPLVLLALLIISTILVLLFYVVPLLLTKKVARLPGKYGLFFISIGLAFMFIEICLIQKGSLYLEHPTFSLTAVLFSMLAAAGLGSWWSGRISDTHLARRMITVGSLIVLMVIILGVVLDSIVSRSITLPLFLKMPLFMALVAVVAFFMGMLFPSGIRLVSRDHRDSIPWVWALNGGASVTGSILAINTAMMFGYQVTLFAGAMCYLCAVLLMTAINKYQ